VRERERERERESVRERGENQGEEAGFNVREVRLGQRRRLIGERECV